MQEGFGIESNVLVDGGESARFDFIKQGGETAFLSGRCHIWGSRDLQRVAGGSRNWSTTACFIQGIYHNVFYNYYVFDRRVDTVWNAWNKG